MLRRSLLAGLLGSPAMVFSRGQVGFNSPGLVIANKVIIEGATGGEFIYSSKPPAADTLIYSNTAVGGTDAKGNVYLSGSVSYGSFGGAFFAKQDLGGFTTYYQNATLGHMSGAWNAIGEVQIFSAATGGLLISSVGALPLPITLNPHANQNVDTTSPIVFANAVGTEETWHNLGTILAGWTVGGRARYKMLSDSGLVLVELENIQLPGAPPADGTAIWTAATGLPAAYRPAVATGRFGTYYNGGAGGEHPAWQFGTDGSINVWGVGGTTIARMDADYMLIPTF